MIRVVRVAAPAKLAAAAAKELAEVIDHYEVAKNTETFGFKAYKTDGVTAALNEMFHGKCAYCESRFAAIQPTDIEHFRPKGAVLVGDRLSAPGYYWLAAEWDNLLPSCIFCNRPNRLELPEAERRLTQGKGNHFPLYDELTRARLPKHELTREVPLLIDPCGAIDPREHLVFGGDGWVRARKLLDGTPSPFGRTTIEVVGLQRIELITDRRAMAIRILGDLRLIVDLNIFAGTAAGAYLQGRRLRELARYVDPEHPFVALAMDLIDSEQPGLLKELPRILRKLESMPEPPKAEMRSIVAMMG